MSTPRIAGIAVLIFLFWYFSPLFYLTVYPASSTEADFGPDVFSEPLQEETDKEKFQITDRNGTHITIIPVAKYEIGGRVAVRRTYPNYFNVIELEDVLTADMAMVWGKFTYDNIFNKVKFSHLWTYSTFSYRDPELSKDPGLEYLSQHFSSNHLIAANKNIDHAIRRAGKGDKVKISGYLIDLEIPLAASRVRGQAGPTLIKTSTVRTDNWTPGQGNRGGSEFIYVTEFQLGKSVYR